MALLEFQGQYYRIDPETSYVDSNKLLTIGFFIYKNKEIRDREKELLPILHQTLDQILENENKRTEELVKLETELTEIDEYLQDMVDLESFLFDSCYEKTSFTDRVLELLNKYEEFKDLIPYVENPLQHISYASVFEYNFELEPSLENMYNILKTKIGKNTDI